MDKFKLYYFIRENDKINEMNYLRFHKKTLGIKYEDSNNLDRFEYIIFNYSKMNDENKKKIDTLFSKYDKSHIYFTFIKAITKMSCTKKVPNDLEKYFNINTIKESFVQLGLSKEIKRNEKGAYEIILPNEDTIIFKGMIDDQKFLQGLEGHCHSYSDGALDHTYKYIDDVYICTGMFKDIFGNNLYHSIIVEDGIARDYVSNIDMPLEDYIKLFNFKILNMQNKISYKAQVNELNSSDKSFRESHILDPLKITVYNKKMKRK